jgi:hypothetical protein
MGTKIARQRVAVAAATETQRNRAVESDSDATWEAHESAIAREFETFRRVFETSPATPTEAAALFERLAQPLCPDDDFTVIEHAVELWKGGGRGRQFPSAKVWAKQMAAAFRRMAAS